MKNLVKLTLAFALGIIVTLAIFPKFQVQPEPAPVPNIQAEIRLAAETAVMEALAVTMMKPEPVEVKAVQEPKKIEETPEPEEALTETKSVPEPTPAPEPAATPIKQQPTPPPQAKTFVPDYIAPDNEPAVAQEDSYDWANDPAGQIKGPFN